VDFYWLQGTELERLPAFATSLAIGLRLFSIGTVEAREVAIAVALAIGANIVFKHVMVLIVGGRPLFARCAGSMVAVAVGLVVALLLT
jgi:uncharacterized membrane protein (DUF4010 family)